MSDGKTHNNGRVDMRTYKMLCEPIFKEIKKEVDGIRRMVWTLLVTSGLAFLTALINIIIYVTMMRIA